MENVGSVNFCIIWDLKINTFPVFFYIYIPKNVSTPVMQTCTIPPSLAAASLSIWTG